jgi:hypothetical protein
MRPVRYGSRKGLQSSPLQHARTSLFKLVAALAPQILGELGPIRGTEPVDVQFARATIVIELITSGVGRQMDDLVK